MNNELVNKLVQALVHSVLSILKFVFVTPLNLWLKAVERLNAQKAAGTLEMANIQSEWPLLTYVKRFNLDFLFDALAFLAYPLGILLAIYAGFEAGGVASDFNKGIEEAITAGWASEADKLSVFGEFVETLLWSLVGYYFFPVFFYIAHDLFVIVLLPIRKLIDWFKKPAQHMDLDVKNK